MKPGSSPLSARYDERRHVQGNHHFVPTSELFDNETLIQVTLIQVTLIQVQWQPVGEDILAVTQYACRGWSLEWVPL